jgi:hypothetical protein
LAAWPTAAPLFVGSDGDRITRGTLQCRVLRAFRRAGIDADRARGALVHGLRPTFATELANTDVSVYTLMKLLGHESMGALTALRHCGRHRDPHPRSPKQPLRPITARTLTEFEIQIHTRASLAAVRYFDFVTRRPSALAPTCSTSTCWPPRRCSASCAGRWRTSRQRSDDYAQRIANRWTAASACATLKAIEVRLHDSVEDFRKVAVDIYRYDPLRP